MAHLYSKRELLKQEEQQTYEDLLEIQKYGGLESDFGKESDFLDLLAPSPIGTVKKTKRRKPSLQRSEEKPKKIDNETSHSGLDDQEETQSEGA